MAASSKSKIIGTKNHQFTGGGWGLPKGYAHSPMTFTLGPEATDFPGHPNSLASLDFSLKSSPQRPEAPWEPWTRLVDKPWISLDWFDGKVYQKTL